MLAGHVVEIELDAAGFHAAGALLTPRVLAAHLSAGLPGDDRPVILLPRGTIPAGPAADLLLGALADSLGRPIVTAAHAAVTATGLVIAPEPFRRWWPRSLGASRSRRLELLGLVLPPLRTASHLPRSALAPGAQLEESAASQAGQDTHLAEPEAPPSLPRSPQAAPQRLDARLAVPDLTKQTQPPALPIAEPHWVTPHENLSNDAPADTLRGGPRRPASGGVLTRAETAAGAATTARPFAGIRPAASPAVLQAPIVVGAEAARMLDKRVVSPEVMSVPTAPRPLPADEVEQQPTANVPAEVLAVAQPPAAGPQTADPPTITSKRTALWLTSEAPGTGDDTVSRAELRQILGSRYDAHARLITKTLAEQPGLRAVAGTADGIAAGLVAVRAFLEDESDFVNCGLRGEVAPDDRVRLLARYIHYGLCRLPTVFGPVYTSTAVGPDRIAGLRPGQDLVEPALVGARARPGPATEERVELAIWSTSAHRLGELAEDEGAALFIPGSRFRVLAVDEADGAIPARLLLRDLNGVRRDADGAERIVARLRDAPRAKSWGAAGAQTFLPGFDDEGYMYPDPENGAA
ncbi:hypothetical protein ACIA5C_45050 [Actinoplanes sp. NPDC051343]|uniref:hypothetical protein n=1 Tax=Actinoplanes sp. NPDC051343 TaxID=3363906 RepID=UPI003795DE62